jgi:hypothetical protein
LPKNFASSIVTHDFVGLAQIRQRLCSQSEQLPNDSRLRSKASQLQGHGAVRPCERIRPLILQLMLIAGIVVATPISGTAQTVARTFDDLRGTAHRDETVFVTDQTGTTVKGRVIEISPTVITLLVRGDLRQWPATDVSWVTQRRRHAGRGAVMGLAFGAFYGAILAVTDPPKSGVKGEDILFVGAYFGGIGAGIGAAIGSAIETEHVLYAAPTRSGRYGLASLSADMIGLHARLSF